MHATRSIAAEPVVISLWPGGAPGSGGWTQQEVEEAYSPGRTIVRNVTQPTLTAYLPEPAVANGTAVIVCPGGASHFLAISWEGTDVARWLNAHGIAAFVLKYRLIRTGEDYRAVMQERMRDRALMDRLMKEISPLQLADAQQAIRLVRQRAAEWGIAPDRVGIMGFSAGGGVTVSVALAHDADNRPDFAAPIYSAHWIERPVPEDAPPLFALCAADDEMASPNSIRLYREWRAAGLPAELHIYGQGGHGFGMDRHGLPVDTWIERFSDWLQALGMLEPVS
jgi:acetyl esterase/lipase